MAGGLDLVFVKFLAEWELSHPEVKCDDWLALADHALQDFRLEFVRIPKDLKNKPMSGCIVVEKRPVSPRKVAHI